MVESKLRRSRSAAALRSGALSTAIALVLCCTREAAASVVSDLPLLSRAAAAPRAPAHTRAAARGFSRARPQAASFTVTTCNDDGPGSLRDTIKRFALSGDTIDLRQLDCSVISLTTGAIVIGADSLQVIGPGKGRFTITANRSSQLFYHYGRGVLRLEGFKMKYGSTSAASNYALGGCVYSEGSLTLLDTTVTSCSVSVSGAADGRGGGVYALDSVEVHDSVVSGNVVDARNSTGVASGGGISAHNTLFMTSSTISGNAVLSAAESIASGGGLHSGSTMDLSYVTLVGNSANFGGGISADAALYIDHSLLSGNSARAAGAVFASYAGRAPAKILDVTVSGNSAEEVGGIVVLRQDMTLGNSTVAFNTATDNRGPAGLIAGGPVTLDAAIIANNTIAGALADFSSDAAPAGALNLITSDAPLAGLAINSCPRLAPLADNGGATLTHALGSASPAHNGGNNVFALTSDQRGMPRTVGGGPDIGAFESSDGTPDLIFRARFENRCD